MRCRGKTFPVGASWLVDVHVSVDDAGHHDEISGFVQRGVWWNFIEAGDGGDHAAAHVNRRWALDFGRDDALAADDQIGCCRWAARRLGGILHRIDQSARDSRNSAHKLRATLRR